RADHLPHLEVALTEDPTKGNALRVKGGGEAGITPSSAVLMNAVLDALSAIGIEHMDTPATPQRVWSAIRAARDGSRDSQRLARRCGQGEYAAGRADWGLARPRLMPRILRDRSQRRRARVRARELPHAGMLRCQGVGDARRRSAHRR